MISVIHLFTHLIHVYWILIIYGQEPFETAGRAINKLDKHDSSASYFLGKKGRGKNVFKILF